MTLRDKTKRITVLKLLLSVLLVHLIILGFKDINYCRISDVHSKPYLLPVCRQIGKSAVLMPLRYQISTNGCIIF